MGLDESHKRPALCDLLLREFPALRIIAVAPGQGRLVVFAALRVGVT